MGSAGFPKSWIFLTLLSSFFLLQLQEKILLTQKFHLSFIANIISLNFFLKLGCDSLFYNIYQGHRQNLYYLVRLTKYSWNAGQHQIKKEFICSKRDKILGQKKCPSIVLILSANLPGVTI